MTETARIWGHTVLHISLERLLRWLYWKLFGPDPMKQIENPVALVSSKCCQKLEELTC